VVSSFEHFSRTEGASVNTRFDVAKYHKPLSVCCFGGITLGLALGSGWSFNNGNTLLGLGFGATFLVVGALVALYFLELFVWAPRRGAAREYGRMQQFRTAERHREDRVRQRARGLRG
jgi:hypothetical protein